MRPNRTLQVGLVLSFATLALVPLNLLESPRPPPHDISALTALRLVIGLPVVLLVPSWFVAPFLFRRDLLAGSDRNQRGLDPIWLVLAAVGLNLGCHFLHFNLLRLLSVPIRWGPLLAVLSVECLVGVILLARSEEGRSFQVLPRTTVIGLAVGVGVILAFAVWKAPDLTRDSSWYFDNDILNQGWEASEEQGDIHVEWEDGRTFHQGRAVRPRDEAETLWVKNTSDRPQRVPVYFLVHGKVGSAAALVLHDLSRATPGISPNSLHGEPVRIEQGPMIEGLGRVERYWEWGSALVATVLNVPAKGSAAVDIRIIAADPTVRPPPLEDFEILALANLAGGEARGELAALGIHSMHPFQMLNVTENVRWAAEVASNRVLPGHSPPWADPPSTLHQPPAWTYLYAPARELLSPQLVSASMLLVLTLLGIVVVGIKGLELQNSTLPTGVAICLALTLAFNAVQHGRMMVSDGSMNFPDNLFALAILISTVSLCAGRHQVFVLWAFLAAVLRYPGVVVVLFAGIALLMVDARRRNQVIDGLMRFGLGIGVFCGAMLIAGGLGGMLPTWLYALYFETIPEHFHNPGEGSDPLLARPWGFFKMWFLAGGAALILAFPFRGSLSKVAAATAFLYFPCLAFIHHYSHHYFLPLIGLAGLAAVASIANRAPDRSQWTLSILLALMTAALMRYATVISL